MSTGGMGTRTVGSGARSRRRMVAISTGVLAWLVFVLIMAPGGVSAAPGPTDLALTKSDSPDPVTQGNTLTYTIRVNNMGTNDATNVVVTDTLPSRVDYLSSTPSSGTCQRAGKTVTCDLGTVNAGMTATVTIAVKAKKHGSISNTASLTSLDDTNSANNQDTESTTISKKAKGPKKPKKVKGQPSCARPTIVGTPGNDRLVGTGNADVISARAGSDRVFAGGGNDLICGQRGADRISGGLGADTEIGGPGRDRLIGGGGADLLKGKGGRDRLRGQRGRDFLNGGRRRDSCKGGPGRDTLRRCP